MSPITTMGTLGPLSDGFPEQVAVRPEEAEGQERQRREAARARLDRNGERCGIERGRRDPCPARSQVEARSRAEEQRVEDDVRRPELGGGAVRPDERDG